MNNIFKNSKNSKTSDPYRPLLNLTDKINLRGSDKYVSLSNLSIYYTWEIMEMSHKNNKFKISASTWNEEFELPDGSYSISYIQDYFDYIFKTTWRKTANPPIRTYVNKIENRITFKIETEYYVELLTPETIKLLRSTRSKITENKTVENVPYLEIPEVILVHCNIVNSYSQPHSRVLYTFVPNKSFGQLLDISPEIVIF